MGWRGSPLGVLAVIDDNGKTVVDSLKAEDDYRHAEKLLALIQGEVPRHGPPTNPHKCLKLSADIWEFKAGPKNGKKIRALWFHDAGDPVRRRRLICTLYWFYKRDKTSATDVKRAEDMLKAYKAAKAAGSLKIEPREDSKK